VSDAAIIRASIIASANARRSRVAVRNIGPQAEISLNLSQPVSLIEERSRGPTIRRHDLLQLLDQLNPWIGELDRAVMREVQGRPEALHLTREPGVGPVTALAFVLTIGPVKDDVLPSVRIPNETGLPVGTSGFRCGTDLRMARHAPPLKAKRLVE
jgi:transposase